MKSPLLCTQYEEIDANIQHSPLQTSEFKQKLGGKFITIPNQNQFGVYFTVVVI